MNSPTIDKTILLVHQHLHTQTPQGIGTYKYATGMVCLISDHFRLAINLIPVRVCADGENSAEIAYYPDNVVCRVLFQRALREPKARVALRHLAAVPTIFREVGAADIVQIRLPSYPAVIASLVAVALGKPMLTSIHGNWGEVIAERHGRSKLRWRLLVAALDRYHRAVARLSALTLVVGERGRDLGGPDAVVIANHQYEASDMYQRPDTCQEQPYQLLYVGVLSAHKGVLYLLDALRQLVGDGLPCTLTLVGREVGLDICREIGKRGLDRAVRVAGYVHWGTDLFALYRASDVFVFPSLGGEGSPKAPMEALSQSLPVIATPVGSSDFIGHEHSGLLVPPQDAAAIAAAVQRMVREQTLRRRCIAQGFAVAQQHTRTRMQETLRRVLTDALAT